MRNPRTLSTSLRLCLFVIGLGLALPTTPIHSQTSHLGRLEGRWALAIEDDLRKIEMAADLRFEGASQAKLVLLGRTDGEDGLFSGTLEDERLLLKGVMRRRPVQLELTVDGDRVHGVLSGEWIHADVSGTHSPDAGVEIAAKRYEELMSVILDGVQGSFYNRKLNDVDLKSLRARFRPLMKAARNDGELTVVVRKMLREFGVSHLEFFLDSGQPQVFYKQPPVVWRQVDPEIGYIAIFEFPAGNLSQFDSLLNRAIWEQVNRPGLVIDLRGNQGERLEAALVALNIVLPEGRPVAYFANRSALDRLSSPDMDLIDRSKLPGAYIGDNLETRKFQGSGMYWAGGKVKVPYQGRIAVLLDESSEGSAELFAAVMKEAGAATIFGRRTRGAGLVSNPIDFLIYGWSWYPREQVRGWRLEAPVMEIRTAGGVRIEGRGVKPDILVERDSTRDADLDRAVEWLHEQL
jgi:hypothetical protein